MFARGVYGTHPAARLSPTVAALDKTTRDALTAFHRAHYAPDHAGIADRRRHLDGRGAKADRREAGGLDQGGRAVATVSEPAALAGPKIFFIARPNSVQTNLIVGTQAIARTQSRLRRAAGHEQGDRRRTDRPAVHSSARGKGLHLRREQLAERADVPRRLVGVDERPLGGDRAGAARPARGGRAAPRPAGVGHRSSPTRSDR